MIEDKPKGGFQLLGLKCWKCHGDAGALCIPFESTDTPETIGSFLFSLRIIPECNNCINNNPRFLSFEVADKGR